MTDSRVALAQQPLADFRRLADNVSLYTPPSQTNNTPEVLIVLCTWMSAASKHIEKYTQGYQAVFPSARILLVRNFLPDFFRTTAAYRKRLEPAVAVIRAITGSAKQDITPNILLHSFSNGGANQLCLLAKFYKEAEGRVIPARALILDSSPGKGTWKRSHAAIMLSLPKRFLVQLFGGLLLHFVFVCAAIYYTVMRKKDGVEVLRQKLNDSALFDQRSRRLYMYSEADEMVWFRHVEEHADDAERNGWRVSKVKFMKSAHAANVTEDSDRYWNGVRRAWDGF